MGHAFGCYLGVLNFWLPIRVRNVAVGIACLQALPHRQSQALDARESMGAAARGLNPAEFQRAARLLRLIVQHVQTLDLAELRKVDLENARRALTALAVTQDHLHLEPNATVSSAAAALPAGAPESRSRQVVHRLLESIHQNFGQPITLKDCAGRLRMNAAYLSALFSQIVGLPFKSYLTELRLREAQRLLHDPARQVSEVAEAVGYSSENRFRIAFKKTTGLSPKAWRETFIQTNVG
jgi:AraC-like DNA-binding protein